MIERNRTIYIGRDEQIPDVLRELLGLADDPAEVQMVVGSRQVLVTEELQRRFEVARSGPDLDEDGAAQPAVEEKPAPRKRQPRKAAPAAPEES